MCKGEKKRFHGNWPGGQGRCMFAPLIPVNADRSQHEDAAYFSLSFLHFQFRSSSLHMSGPSSLSSPWPFLLDLSISRTPVLSLQVSFCLYLCLLVSQGQKQRVENGLWRNVCSSSGTKKQERRSSNSFDCYLHCYRWSQWRVISHWLYLILQELFFNFTHLNYIQIYTNWNNMHFEHEMIFFQSTRDLNIWGWQMYLLVWHKDECCYLGFSTQSISQSIYSPLNHPPDLSSSHFLHPPSAHANSYSLPDSAQSVFYLTLIKPVFLPPPRKGWVAILSGAHPINLSCQSWDFSTGRVRSSARRVLAWRESPQAKQKLSFYLLNSEWTLWKWNPSESVLTACHLRQH